jgi:hypothetical protein
MLACEQGNVGCVQGNVGCVQGNVGCVQGNVGRVQSNIVHEAASFIYIFSIKFIFAFLQLSTMILYIQSRQNNFYINME